MDKQYGNTANTAYIPSYWRFDAMAGYRFNKNWNMQLNVFNLFDKTYYDKAYAALRQRRAGPLGDPEREHALLIRVCPGKQKPP